MTSINSDNINQTIISCAALTDAIVYLSAMSKKGFCVIKAPSFGQHETLHFVTNSSGASLLVSLAFDSERKPILYTTDKESLRWFSVIHWDFLLLKKDRIILQGEMIEIGEGASIPGIIIELPIGEKINQALARYKWIGIGYSIHSTTNINVEGGCQIVSCLQ